MHHERRPSLTVRLLTIHFGVLSWVAMGEGEGEERPKLCSALSSQTPPEYILGARKLSDSDWSDVVRKKDLHQVELYCRFDFVLLPYFAELRRRRGEATRGSDSFGSRSGRNRKRRVIAACSLSFVFVFWLLTFRFVAQTRR